MRLTLSQEKACGGTHENVTSLIDEVRRAAAPSIREGRGKGV